MGISTTPVGGISQISITWLAGSLLLYNGQENFQTSIVNILSYVLHQADTVVENLTNLFSYLVSAKNVVPAELRGNIDGIHTQINLVSSTILNGIYVATALTVLALLGFLFSILGIQCLVHILVIIGWMLITVTFILSGMSLLVHNVVADTCIAMDDWRQNPTADSALEDIIPKVDNEMTQQIFNVTKATTYGAVSGVNGAILNVSNADNPPDLGPPPYFNQSGPLMPVLCNPYNADLTDRQCAAGEVDFKNSTEVWRTYICEVSESGICITPGRVTPDGYNWMLSLTNLTLRETGNPTLILQALGIWLKSLSCTPAKFLTPAFKHLQIAFLSSTDFTLCASCCSPLQHAARWLRILAGGKSHARGSLHVDSAAWYGRVAHMSAEEEEQGEEEDRKQ
ncbi:hypothetical protein F0562_030251 [Nyssa sinensis]|uniref:Uncharacterized protein n=1 Tax=Nyssa sinensis TaxID=561372 RepID=A0A5J5AYE8_9ASTE|nr:hypothetical protein F0562_030251 [Nyssa sinensis]